MEYDANTKSYSKVWLLESLSDGGVQKRDMLDSKYNGTLSIPTIAITRAVTVFLISLYGKTNYTGMYCSKLVYSTFISYVDLDSNRTSMHVKNFFSKEKNDRNKDVTYAWIGVSPDDIYWSKKLTLPIASLGLFKNAIWFDKNLQGEKIMPASIK
ncbi:MAG: hypothetical protein A2X41_03690 [Candidatus Margulisbacteria bacterium GWE2_39_32]|nr:MAG: hypothetical protein A2X41_03690 [Candidatus Margulisbacteria bacterium GWE2_39_32]